MVHGVVDLAFIYHLQCNSVKGMVGVRVAHVTDHMIILT